MPSLEHIYQEKVDSDEIIDDPIQRQLIQSLQIRYDQLTQKKSFWQSLFKRNHLIQGLYLWGGVGIGKTFLMDLFFDALPFKEKTRLHFHGFMQKVQEGLKAREGQANPLEAVAEKIAQETRVLCFDEFFVSDIADAMILERLFTALFEKGVILIATSNIPPDNLYYKGLHRKRFLPAIELIKQHSEVINVNSQQDYRFRTLEQVGVYFTPNNRSAEKKMACLFDLYCQPPAQENIKLNIENRGILAKKVNEHAVWFDFDVICHTPRSQVDYLRISEQYQAVFISNVPIIGAKDKATITYLIHLVDVFYDQNIKLILSAEAEIEALYTEGDKKFEYQRTISRLHEMRSRAYLNRD